MRKIYLILLTSIILLNSQSIFSQGHKIDIEIKGAENQELLLVHYYGNKHFIDDTLHFDSKGKALIQGDTLLPEGLYIIYWPNKANIDILVGKDQQFSMKTDTINILKNLVIKDSEPAQKMLELQRLMSRLGRENMFLQERMKQNVLNTDSLTILQDLQDENGKLMSQAWEKIATENPESMLEIMGNLMKNIEIPEFDIPEEINNKDSMQWIMSYSYNKNHFFDFIPLDDPRILRTPIFHANKLDHFFKKMLPQHPDTLVKYAHKVIERTNGNTEMINYLTRYFINYSQKSDRMGMDKIFVEISERYILTKKANWPNEETMKKIRDEVAKNKYNLIGLQAIDLKMQNLDGEYERLSDIESKFTLVYFWEPDCGHCKKTTPKVYEQFLKYDRSEFDVFAVCTITDKEKWTKYISEKGYEWTNVYDPEHTTNFRFFYNIYSTPTMYLLDENKKIIAKRFGFENLEEILKIELGEREVKQENQE